VIAQRMCRQPWKPRAAWFALGFLLVSARTRQ
jgi:hypothetical protein